MDAAIKEKIETFFKNYQYRQYRKGEVLVRADEDPPGVFYLVSGKVRQYDINDQGTVMILNIFKPPAFFPMSWAINQSPNAYFFEAMEPVELWLAPRQNAVDFIHANSDVQFNLLSRLYRGTDGLLLKMTHLMGASAYSRVMLELIIAAKRFGKPSLKDEVKLDVTAAELAGRTGLTRETVSREIQKLKAKKLIRVSLGTIVIPDLAMLEEEHSLGTS